MTSSLNIIFNSDMLKRSQFQLKARIAKMIHTRNKNKGKQRVCISANLFLSRVLLKAAPIEPSKCPRVDKYTKSTIFKLNGN